MVPTIQFYNNNSTPFPTDGQRKLPGMIPCLCFMYILSSPRTTCLRQQLMGNINQRVSRIQTTMEGYAMHALQHSDDDEKYGEVGSLPDDSLVVAPVLKAFLKKSFLRCVYAFNVININTAIMQRMQRFAVSTLAFKGGGLVMKGIYCVNLIYNPGGCRRN